MRLPPLLKTAFLLLVIILMVKVFCQGQPEVQILVVWSFPILLMEALSPAAADDAPEKLTREIYTFLIK
jgi:hypothetical protein